MEESGKKRGSLYEAINIRFQVAWIYIKFMCRGIAVKRDIEKQFTAPPILIGGCGRSGTTLLLSILSASPEVFAIPVESGIFCKTEPRTLFVNWRYNLTFFYGRYFKKIPDTSTRWCEKTPMNVRFFDAILNKFNNQVKLVHIIRDGRDTVLSKHPLDKNRYWVDPERWVSDVRAGLKFQNHENVITIKYEDLILNYESVIKQLVVFLNIPAHEKLIEWHQNTTVKKNRAWSGEVQPLFNDSVGKWKAPEYADRVADFMSHPEAVQLLKELGYKA